MDRQRGGQKKKGNRNQQGSNKSKGGQRPGFVTSKNRFGGNAGAKAKSGRKVNLGKQPGRSNRYYFNLYREERGGRQGGTVNKAKTTTITRTVNDLRQLIRPKVDKTPKTAAKPNVQNKKLSIKKRLGLQSKSARAATVTARRNVTTATRMEVDRVTIPKITVRNRNLNNALSSKAQSKNRVWRRNDQSQPVAPTVIIAQAPPIPLTSNSSGRSKARGNSVVISNLKAGISHKDVEDLFGDIGPASVQMIDSHTAIVTYGDPNHAGRAVDVYHNRLLDGYPMQCTLIPAANVVSTQSPGGFVSRTMRQIFS